MLRPLMLREIVMLVTAHSVLPKSISNVPVPPAAMSPMLAR